MKYMLAAALLLFAAQGAFAQEVQRQNGEPPEIFADRLKPDSTELAHAVFETRALDTTQAIIVAFYKKTVYETRQLATYVDHSQYDILLGYLFLPTGGNSYKKQFIDTIPPDGADPEIAAVFFANADAEPGQELVVLCTYLQRHYDISGTSYAPYVYKYKNGTTTYLESVSSKLSGCDCGWRDGTAEKARYRTAGDIRRGLTRMGYKQ